MMLYWRKTNRACHIKEEIIIGGVYNMAHVMVMPKLGLAMEDGKITSWLKSEGDSVNEGEEIFEVETEKISQPVESDTTGVLLKIIVAEGETADCLAPVAIIGEPNEDISGLV